MSPAAGSRPDADPARPAPTSSDAAIEHDERRKFFLAGGVFVGAMVVLIAVAVLFSGDAGDPRTSASTTPCAPDDVECEASQQSAERPGIIPKPGEGQAPDEPGDRGGWEQIAVFVALVAGISLIIAMVVRSSRRARARAGADGPPPPSR